MRLVVTVDTEADNQWDHGAPVTTHNVAHWQPFMDVCERHGVRPTYLITSEIVDDDRAAETLRRWAIEQRVEIGAHLHPWTTPPFLDRPGLRFNDLIHAFPLDLPERLLLQKLSTLTDRIHEQTGVRPTSFRAGRFGFDATCARLLAGLGYAVDSSVTPSVDWRGTSGMPGAGGGPDFRSHTVRPFLIADAAPHTLVELPVTIMHTDRYVRRFPAAKGVLLSRPFRIARALRHRGRRPEPMWLRPFPGVTTRDLEALCRTALEAGTETVVMMFHSSELMPGGSPYRPTERSVRDLLTLLGEFFSYVIAAGGTCVTLSEAASAVLTTGLRVRAL